MNGEVIAQQNGRNVTSLDNQARETTRQAPVPLAQCSNTRSSSRAWKYLIHYPAMGTPPPRKFKRSRFGQHQPKEEKTNAQKHQEPETRAGDKNLTQPGKACIGGENRGKKKNKNYGRVGQQEMELREDNWVIGNLTSVYENIPLIFIAQS